MYVYVEQHIPSAEMKILERDSGTVLSGNVPSIVKIRALLPVKIERSKIITSNVKYIEEISRNGQTTYHLILIPGFLQLSFLDLLSTM